MACEQVYPTAGPTDGGTFVQVRGVGLYASATGEANPLMWRLSFVANDGDADAQLDATELDSLVAQLREDGALPETVLTTRASVRALAAAHDANADGLLSFDEFLAARPGGVSNESSALPTLPASWAPRCGFGPVASSGLAGWTDDSLETVVATAHAGEWIACHAPSARAVRASSALEQRFEDGESLDGWRVLKVARLPHTRGGERPEPQDVTTGVYSIVNGGVLEMTNVEQGTGATALFRLPLPPAPAPVSAFFRASFRVHISGGSGGDGISWSYGELDDEYIDEMGAGSGLRLQLRTAAVQQASLIYAGETIDVVSLPRSQLRGAWRTVTISHSQAGVSVSLDRSMLFVGVRLAGFAPRPSWRMAFGARCGALHDAHLLDDVRVERGAQLGRGHAPVELASNGRDYSISAVLFEYYPPPRVEAVDPPCGPIDGGTVVTLRGTGLQRLAPLRAAANRSDLAAADDSGYKCGWGACDCALRTDCVCANVTRAHWDDALHAIVCTAPRWLGDDANASGALQDALRVSLNGQDFHDVGHSFWRYTHPPSGATYLQLDPLNGPARGGTLVQLWPPDGMPHGSKYECRFGDRLVPASYGGNASAVRSLHCVSPAAAAAGPVDLFLTLNGQQFVPLGLPGERFTYYNPPGVLSIDPSGGPIHGGTLVRVNGNWSAGPLAPSERLRCRFGAELVSATRDDDGRTLLCRSPVIPRAGLRRILGSAGDAPTIVHSALHVRSDWQEGESTEGGNLFFAQVCATSNTLTTVPAPLDARRPSTHTLTPSLTAC